MVCSQERYIYIYIFDSFPVQLCWEYNIFKCILADSHFPTDVTREWNLLVTILDERLYVRNQLKIIISSGNCTLHYHTDCNTLSSYLIQDSSNITNRNSLNKRHLCLWRSFLNMKFVLSPIYSIRMKLFGPFPSENMRKKDCPFFVWEAYDKNRNAVIRYIKSI